MTTNQNHGGQPNPERNKNGFAMMAMMAMMMGCCMAVVLLFLLIPVVGWPIGLTIGIVGLVAMLFGHHRSMGRGVHH
ncbi:MAG: hypothetical protein ABI577_00190 [bacterium]